MNDAPKASPPRTQPPPSAGKLMNAARAEQAPVQRQALNKEVLAAGATDTALNAISVVKETWADFKSQSRHFKLKVAIIGSWILLSATSFALAFPPSTSANNNIRAQLVVAGEATRPVYMVRNDSTDTWKDVKITVNGTYWVSLPQMDPNGDFTLSAKVLKGAGGTQAPPSLRITRIELSSSEGNALLLENAQPR